MQDLPGNRSSRFTDRTQFVAHNLPPLKDSPAKQRSRTPAPARPQHGHQQRPSTPSYDIQGHVQDRQDDQAERSRAVVRNPNWVYAGTKHVWPRRETQPAAHHEVYQHRNYTSIGHLPPASNLPTVGESIAGSFYLEEEIWLNGTPHGFGFRVVGGTEDGSQASIGHIVDGGVAFQDGRMKIGDEIVEVDGITTLGASHQKIIQLIESAGQVLRVKVRRAVATSATTSRKDIDYRLDEPNDRFEVTVSRSSLAESFGFVVTTHVSNHTTGQPPRLGLSIGQIITGSPADRCGQLNIGDRIMFVNNVDVSRMSHDDVVQMVKNSGLTVRLIVQSHAIRRAMSTPQIPASQSPSRNINRQPPLPRQQMVTTNQNEAVARTGADHANQLHRYHSYTPQHSLEEDVVSGSSHASADDIYTVELHRGNRGFGFSIRGGREFNNMPLFVLRMADGGAAAQDARLKVGDEILQIHGVRTEGMTHRHAIELIQNGGSVVRLVMRRHPPPNKPLHSSASAFYSLQQSSQQRNGNLQRQPITT